MQLVERTLAYDACTSCVVNKNFWWGLNWKLFIMLYLHLEDLWERNTYAKNEFLPNLTNMCKCKTLHKVHCPYKCFKPPQVCSISKWERSCKSIHLIITVFKTHFTMKDMFGFPESINHIFMLACSFDSSWPFYGCFFTSVAALSISWKIKP